MSSSMLTERVRAQLAGLAGGGLDTATYARSALETLGRAVPFTAACFATADPATGLVTSTVKWGGLGDARDEEWAHFEYEVPDPSTFLEVARRPGGVLAVRGSGDGAPSPRFDDFIRPNWDFGDELRAALRTDGATWGFLALFRDGPGSVFTPVEQEFVSGVGASLATGLRAGVLATAATGVDPGVEGPAVLVVDARGEVLSASVGAAARVADIGGGAPGEAPLPLALLTLVGAARQFGRDSTPVVPKVRLRTRSGHWVVAHASRLVARDGATPDVVVTIEEARPPEIVPLVVAAFGLTPRERDVVALVLQGVDTAAIAAALHLSAYTVQDHLKAIFAKVGVRSRRELIATVFFDQYAPRLAAGDGVAPSGWFAAVPGPRAGD